MFSADGDSGKELRAGLKLKKLNVEQVKRIDALLASLGDYGEIRLIVQHGELRFINKVESYRAWRDDDEEKPADE
jgi:hypothetical protein